MKGERNYNLGGYLTERTARMEDFPKVSKKSTAVGLRREKQREIHTGNQYHCPEHQSLRHLGRSWVLRLGLCRLVLGKYQVWLNGDNYGLGSKAVECHSIGSMGGGLGLWEKQGTHCQGEGGGRVNSQQAGCLLCGLQAVGANCCSLLRFQRLLSATIRQHLWPQAPEGLPQRMLLQLSTTHYPHPPWNAQALMLPLPKALGAAYSSLRVTATSQGPSTRSSLLYLHRSSPL